jgi:general secretion pathway protein F/type IV pilus assembly protein PilC
MVEVLTNMSDFFSTQTKVKKQVKGAMIYPSVILVVAILIIAFLLVSVVPQITQIFEDTDQALPQVTQVVVATSNFLIANYLYILIGLIASIALFKLSYAKVEAFHKLIDGLLLKVPLIGNLIQNHELGRFSYILSLMLSSGVAYAQAVKLAKSTFSNYQLSDLFNKASIKVEEGNKLSNSLQMVNSVRLKRNFMQTLALGEESSEVAEVLSNTSSLYAEENDDKLKILLSLLNPFMMLFIGGFVGVIIAAMMLPIFTMTQGLQ